MLLAKKQISKNEKCKNKIYKYLNSKVTLKIIDLFSADDYNDIPKTVGDIDNIKLISKFRKKTKCLLNKCLYNGITYLLLFHLEANCDKLENELLYNLHKDDYKIYYMEIKNILSRLFNN